MSCLVVNASRGRIHTCIRWNFHLSILPSPTDCSSCQRIPSDLEPHMATYAALPTAPGSYTHSIDSSRPHVTPHSLRDLELDSPSHSPPPRPPRHTRSDTLGSLSGFNFGRAGAIGGLEIPLSLSAEESERNAGRERGSGTGGVTDRHVGLIDGKL